MASGLGIDLGSSAIKVVRLRKRGAAWEVLGAFRMDDPSPPSKAPAKPGDPLPPRTLPQDLAARISAARISGSGALGITGRDLMVKYVSTPPIPPWKLRLMMDLEIKGTSGAEVCGDYAGLNIPGDLTRELVSIVAVAKTGYVESQMALAKGIGLGAEWCCPGAIGLFNAFVASAQYRPGETVAVLDVGRENMELVLQRDGVLYFARSTPGGGRRFTEAVDGVFSLGYERSEQYKCMRAAIHAGDPAGLEASQLKVSGALREVADTLASTVRGAVMFCKAQAKIAKLDVDRLVLSGGGAQLRGLAEHLKDKLKVPVDLLDPASRLDISRLPRDQQALLEGPGAAGMSVAIGLAMAAADETAMCLSVVPDRVVKVRRFWRGTVWAIGAAVALAGILAVDYVAATRSEQVMSKRKEAYEQNLAVLQQKAKQVEAEAKVNHEMKSRAEMIVGPAQRNRPVLGFLSLIRDETPEGITLERLAVGADDEDGAATGDVKVTVSGRLDPGAVGQGAPASTDAIFDALKSYVAKLNGEHPQQGFKASAAKITTMQSDLERPAAGDRRIPFTFEVRLVTLGVAVESSEDPESRASGPDTQSIIPRGPATPVPFPGGLDPRGAPGPLPGQVPAPVPGADGEVAP